MSFPIWFFCLDDGQFFLLSSEFLSVMALRMDSFPSVSRIFVRHGFDDGQFSCCLLDFCPSSSPL